MKNPYKITIIFLILITIIIVLKISMSKPETESEDTRLNDSLLVIGIFAALLTAVISLSVADPKRPSVNITMDISVDNEGDKHSKVELADYLKPTYEHLDDPFKSYQVWFKMVNTSGFSFKKPVLTFRLPLKQQHPIRRKGYEMYTESGFASNLYNSQAELQKLELADTFILSNSNLPYWNNKDPINIWIRMLLDKPFLVEVSINCENAEGKTISCHINPQELLR